MINVKSSTLRKFRGKEVAYIFQEPMTALNPVYTIGFQIVETLRNHFDMGPKQARTRAVELLTMVKSQVQSNHLISILTNYQVVSAREQ